ncbi:MAG: CoA transferase [Rhodospirillaceae bacterium]|nr:CoA transferase [Rhodospirillaceae bacterium]
MSPPLPLLGIRVIEFCHVAAGPFCGMTLADMGADLIKVEPLKGDSLRTWPPFSDGYSENFASINRNKRSIALDLKDTDSLALARRLILSADAVVENNRPGVMARLGLGYDTFKDEKPDLIYASISAFGQTGPRAQDGGFDITVQAASGVMSVTGDADRTPVKAGVPVSDFGAGLYAAFAIVSLLRRVEAGGVGGHIDMSMYGTNLSFSALQTSEYFGTGNDPVRMGSSHPRNSPYEAYAAADGHIVLAAGNDKLFASACEVIGYPSLKDDPRFLTTGDRAKNQVELKVILQPILEKESIQYWITAFRPLGIPCEPINTYSAALRDPLVEHFGWVQPLTLPNGVKTETFASPIEVAGESFPIRRGPPALNGDHDDIIAELEQLECKV